MAMMKKTFIPKAQSKRNTLSTPKVGGRALGGAPVGQQKTAAKMMKTATPRQAATPTNRTITKPTIGKKAPRASTTPRATGVGSSKLTKKIY